MHTQEIVARIGTIALAHGIKRDVANVIHHLLIPSVDMPTEHDGSIPLAELIQQEECFFASKGGGKLQR